MNEKKVQRMQSLHYRLTEMAIRFGPANPIVRLMLRLQCRGASLKFHPGIVDICMDNRIIRISEKHFPYAADMASNFDTYFSQVLPSQQGTHRVVDYSTPRLQTYANGLAFEISSMPEESEAIDSYFRWYRPRIGDVIFDMGSYCGVSTYFFSKAVGPSGKVFAFEPDPINYSLLRKNIERHHLENVETFPLAIAGRTSTAEFFSEGTMGSTLKRQSSRATLGSVEKVSTISLPDACQKYGLPAFAKIDIEGSEIEMLMSSQDFLRKNDIQFALDTNHRINGKLTTEEVERLFRQCGYEAETSADFGSMTTWARPKRC